MKVIYNNIIPFSGYIAITFFPFIFARRKLNEIDINHETIHGCQQVEVTIASLLILLIMILIFGWSWWLLLLSLPAFYTWYGIEYVIRLVIYSKKKEAYRNISFEQEAYLHEGDLRYTRNRSLFAWIKYLNRKTYIYKTT